MHASPTERQHRRASRHLALPAVVALGLSLGGCFFMANEPKRTASLPEPPKQPEVAPAVAREHQRILGAYGGAYKDARLEAFVKQIVDRLVAASERPDQRYRLTVLNSPAINAFALPSGQLYVTRGLIALANGSSEIASVLAHEMAHVVAQHAEIREDKARTVALVGRVFDNLGTDPEMGALALAKSKIALATFSRTQEFEADGIGIGIATRAGFDPFGASRFLTSMGRNADIKPATQSHIDQRGPDFVSSHPATPQRINNAQTRAREFRGPSDSDPTRAAYLAAIDGVVYGEDPSEGFVRGRRFLHPRLAFTFVAPEGFALDNTAAAVLGIKDGGGQALRLDVVRVPGEQTLPDYLNSGWIEHIDPKSVEELEINGFPAATATARTEQWSFRLFALRFGSDVYRFIFASKQASPEIDRAFREAVHSFRRLSLAEANAAKPLRLKMVTVVADDTAESLARRMAIADRPLERFRVLNGLAPGDRVKPGDQVKLVVE
jgi:predicted Zn-dependent protease